MRIGINLLYLVPSKVGGTETYARGLVAALQKIDKKNEYFLFCNKENRDIFAKSKNFKIIVLPFRASNKVLRVLFEQLALPFYVLRYKIEILHSLGYVAPLINFCSSLVSIHDLNWHFYPEDFNVFEGAALKFLVPNSARICDLVVTVSDSSKRGIVDILGVPKKKVKVVYAGTPKLEKPYSISRLKKLGIYKKYIFTVSASHPHKNLITLIKAFLILKKKSYDLNLVVAGLRGRAHKNVQNFIKKNYLSEDIKILGWVSDKDLSTLYKYSEVVVLPSVHEGFGFPLVEAFSFGKPVVSSNAFSLKEVAGNAAHLVNPLEPDQFADGIARILDNPRYKNKLIKLGEKRFKIFDWRKSARELLNIYQELVNP